MVRLLFLCVAIGCCIYEGAVAAQQPSPAEVAGTEDEVISAMHYPLRVSLPEIPVAVEMPCYMCKTTFDDPLPGEHGWEIAADQLNPAIHFMLSVEKARVEGDGRVVRAHCAGDKQRLPDAEMQAMVGMVSTPGPFRTWEEGDVAYSEDSYETHAADGKKDSWAHISDSTSRSVNAFFARHGLWVHVRASIVEFSPESEKSKVNLRAAVDKLVFRQSYTPDSWDMYRFGVMMGNLGNRPKALEWLRAAINREKVRRTLGRERWVQLFITVADSRYTAVNTAAQIEFLRSGLEQEPSSTELRYQLAKVLAAANDMDGTIATLIDMLTANPWGSLDVDLERLWNEPVLQRFMSNPKFRNALKRITSSKPWDSLSPDEKQKIRRTINNWLAKTGLGRSKEDEESNPDEAERRTNEPSPSPIPTEDRNALLVRSHIADELFAAEQALAGKRFAEALERSNSGLQLLEAMIAAKPEDLEWRRLRAQLLVARSRANLGAGNHTAALAAIEQATNVLATLGRPANDEAAALAAEIALQRGTALSALDDMERAESAFSEAAREFKPRCEQDLADTPACRSYLEAAWRAAIAANSAHKVERARDLWQQAAMVIEQMSGSSEEGLKHNVRFEISLQLCLTSVEAALPQSAKECEALLNIARQRFGLSEGVRVRADLVTALMAATSSERRRGDTSRGRVLVAEAVDHTSKLMSTVPSTQDTTEQLVRLHRLLSRLEQDDEQWDAAERSLRRTLDLLKPSYFGGGLNGESVVADVRVALLRTLRAAGRSVAEQAEYGLVQNQANVLIASPTTDIIDQLNGRRAIFQSAGDAATLAGNLPRARAMFAQALAAATRARGLRPANVDFIRYEAVARQRVGLTQLAEHHFTEAKATFEMSLALFKDLARRDASGLTRRLDVAIEETNVGDAARKSGQLRAAFDAYGRAHELAVQLPAIAADEMDSVGELTDSWLATAEAAKDQGDTRLAEACLVKARELVAAARRVRPASLLWTARGSRSMAAPATKREP